MAKKKKEATTALAVVPPEGIAMAQRYAEDAAASLEAIRGLVVETHEDEVHAVQVAAAVKEKFAEVHELREHLLEPHKLGTERVNGIYMPVEKTLVECERVIKTKIEARHLNAALERDRLLKAVSAASAAGDGAKAEELIAKRDELEPQKIEGRTAATVWIGEVINAAEIPAEYRVPSTELLLAKTKATGGDPEIPGWRAFPKVNTSITVGKVQK